MVWGSGAVWCIVFHPSAVQGVRAELLAGIVYLGHLYAGESGQFRPPIFLGTVWYDAVLCGVSSDPVSVDGMHVF